MNILIVGGTGTLGTELTRQLLKKDYVDRITILSRGEHKQKQHRDLFNDSRLKYVIGDIKDFDSIIYSFIDVDYVFHTAALKHIDVAEDNPIESVKTNILGTINVCKACRHVDATLIFATTDKAVDPINVYGMCKGISEQIIKKAGIDYLIYRWGNVLGSQGSALNIFKEKILSNKPIPITSIQMTRFWISIEEAVEFIMNTFEDYENETLIPEMKSSTILEVIRSICRCLNIDHKKTYSVEVGLRPGEKIHESLTSIHSRKWVNSKDCERYTESELDELINGSL